MLMRYHYEKPEVTTSMYGETYICDHPVYNRCTLIKIGEKGIAIIQQRFDPTVTIRQIMWALRMKPLPKNRWETTFDRRNI